MLMSMRQDSSVLVFMPQDDEASTWVRENVHVEDWQWLGNKAAFATDLRPGSDMIVGFQAAGGTVT